MHYNSIKQWPWLEDTVDSGYYYDYNHDYGNECNECERDPKLQIQYNHDRKCSHRLS